jgi:hypothetical protein
MEEAAEISRSNSNNPTRGFHHPRVGNALEELASGLDEAFKLALQITRVLITSIDPDSGISGQWLTDVRVEGANFQEVMSIKLTKQGANPISGTNFAIVNPTRIRVDFNLTNAVVGQWSVVVTDRNQGEVVLKDVFTINSSSGNGIPVSPSLPPTLTSVEPPSADPDANVTLTLEGDNLDKVTEVLLVREGTPIKANNVEFVDATKQVVASFNLSAIRGNTTWTVVATNPDGEAKWESFTLEEPGLIERVWDEIGDLLRDLESGRQGARNLRVNISGKGLRDAKAVVFGQGITVRSMQFTRDQQLEVKINIAEDAVPGKRDITVIGPDGTPVILTDSFEVIER